MEKRLSDHHIREQFVKIQNLASIGIWELDLARGELMWSHAIYDIFEIDKEKFSASYEAFLGRIHPDDRDAVNKAYTDSLIDKKPYKITHRLLMDDGRIKYIEEQCDTEFDGDGKPLRSTGTSQDVTEHMMALKKITHAERALAKERAFLKSLIDALPDVVFFKDKNSVYVGCNDACASSVNCCVEDVIGKTDFDFFEKEKAESLRAIDREIVTNRTRRSNENTLLKDGKEIHLLTMKSPFYDENGEVAGIVGVSRDITQLKKVIAELESLNAQLEQRVAVEVAKNMEKSHLLAQQAKLAAMGEMIGAIAHQWRQPLNALGIMVQDVPVAYKYGEVDEEYIKKMSSDSMTQIKFMSKTIDDFRNFFKVSKEREQFVVKETVISAELLLSAQFTSDNIVLDTVCDKKCSGCGACSKEVLGYPNELKQVVLNMLSNARDAIRDNRKKTGSDYQGLITVAMEILDDGEGREKISICISDNGGGMPEGVADRVFEPYFTTKEQGEGTGIGLYMSKSIINGSFGGDIFASNDKDGAKFTIVLPLNYE